MQSCITPRCQLVAGHAAHTLCWKSHVRFRAGANENNVGLWCQGCQNLWGKSSGFESRPQKYAPLFSLTVCACQLNLYKATCCECFFLFLIRFTCLSMKPEFGYYKLINRVGRAPSRPNVMSDGLLWASRSTDCISTICTHICTLKLHTDWMQGKSLLHLAVLRNSPDIVEVLLKHGVDVNMLDFMVSCPNGYEEAEPLYRHIASHCGWCRGAHRFIWLQKKVSHAFWNSYWSMVQMWGWQTIEWVLSSLIKTAGVHLTPADDWCQSCYISQCQLAGCVHGIYVVPLLTRAYRPGC